MSDRETPRTAITRPSGFAVLLQPTTQLPNHPTRRRKPTMPQRWVIGLASGASADGVDAALVELEGVGLSLRVRQLSGLHQPYAAELRELIRRVSSPAPCEVRSVSRLHRLLGETFAG